MLKIGFFQSKKLPNRLTGRSIETASTLMNKDLKAEDISTVVSWHIGSLPRLYLVRPRTARARFIPYEPIVLFRIFLGNRRPGTWRHNFYDS
jgi:hypothetical protein